MIMRKLEAVDLALKGAFAIHSMVFNDERGDLHKIYTEELLKSKNVKPYFPEEYASISAKGVLRGMHYQHGEYSQAKLVRCMKGRVYDAFVDLRKGSPTFGKWHGITLSEEDGISVYVPRGFAHGVLALTDGAIFLYKADNHYAPDKERGIAWDDPELKIGWPIADPILSEKDKKWPTMKEAELF